MNTSLFKVCLPLFITSMSLKLKHIKTQTEKQHEVFGKLKLQQLKDSFPCANKARLERIIKCTERFQQSFFRKLASAEVRYDSR